MAVDVVKSNISKKWAILYPIILILIGVGVILLGYFMINKSSGWSDMLPPLKQLNCFEVGASYSRNLMIPVSISYPAVPQP